MICEAINAVRYNGLTQRAGSVFETDARTGNRLFARGAVKPSAGPVREVAEKPAVTERLLKEVGSPTGIKSLGKAKGPLGK
jgi:hypothetical protein